MSLTTLSVAFIPLTDAAPLIAAEEMGFAHEEGLELDLVRAPSCTSTTGSSVAPGPPSRRRLSPPNRRRSRPNRLETVKP